MPRPEQIAFLNEYLATARTAVVAANGESGYPQITPNWFNWDGERLSISTTKDRFCQNSGHDMTFHHKLGPRQ